MERSILLFVECLRRHGIRVSTAEALDALRCAAQPGMLASRERLHAALRSALLTRQSDVSTFDAVFALYFSLRPVPGEALGADQTLTADLPTDGMPADAEADLEDFTLVDATQGTDQISSSPSAEADMSEYFDPDALSEGYNLDDDADIVNLASMTDEISFAPSGGKANARGMKVQLDVSQTHGAQMPGSLTPASGQAVDMDLSGEDERTLLNWLGAGSTSAHVPDDEEISGLLDRLPEYLAEHLRRLAGLRRTAVADESGMPAVLDEVSERERELFEESLRRLARTLQGGLAQKKRQSPRGRVHPAMTTRRSLRYDGVPFRPVTVERVHERSRVLVLADVSLSVRATARFTLHMVHSMHHMFGKARTFAFVDELTEITGLFETHPIEHALGMVFGGSVLDTDASSDYGAVFTQLLESGESLDRKTSLIVVGDGRNNGKDPALDVFAEISRRMRRVLWLTPEPSYSWGLGSCDLPDYARWCEQVEVVRDLSGLERTAERMAAS